MQKLGRLAMRVEGANWAAYYAFPNTMEGAIRLGCISMALVANATRKQAFMDLMKDCVSDLIQSATGETPSWPDGPERAPESERSGRA